MKKLIKKLFKLYDDMDITKRSCEGYIKGYKEGRMDGYDEGKSVGYSLGLYTKHTSNEIREMLGLNPVEKELIVPTENSEDISKRFEEHFKDVLKWMENLGKEGKDER